MPASQNGNAESRPGRGRRGLNLLPFLATALVAVLLAWLWVQTGVWRAPGLGPLVWEAVLAIAMLVVFLGMLAWKFARNRLQFSLKALLIAVAVVGLTLGLVMSYLERTREQRTSAARLLAAGAEVRYRNEGSPGLEALIGWQYSEDVIDVQWDCGKTGNVDLSPLESLKNLESLRLVGDIVTEADLAHLALLSRLRRVTLRQCRISGEGLRHLEGLTELEWLDLSGSTIHNREHVDSTLATDEGVKELQEALPGAVVIGGASR